MPGSVNAIATLAPAPPDALPDFGSPPPAPRRRSSWRSRRRLGVLAGLLAAVAAGLAAVSGTAPPKPLVIHVTGGPAGLAVSDGRVWVAAPGAGAVSVFDAASGEPAAPPLRPGGAPARLALGANGLWVADATAASVVPVQLRPPHVFAAIRPGADATDVALAAGAVWVASSADGRVYALEPGGGPPRALQVGRSPVALAADERRVVAADARAGTLAIIDARNRSIARPPVHVGGAPVDVALSGDTAWAADASSGRIVAVDLNTGRVAGSVDVGNRPVALAAAGGDIYVLCAGDRTLVRVRDGKVRSRRPVGPNPSAIAVDARYVWVAAAGSDELLRFER